MLGAPIQNPESRSQIEEEGGAEAEKEMEEEGLQRNGLMVVKAAAENGLDDGSDVE
jgi:hypothetical protein